MFDEPLVLMAILARMLRCKFHTDFTLENDMQSGKQFGFSLIEIAVVIAIISISLSILFAGQTFTINSKVNRLAHDFQIIQTAIYDAQERLRPVHGNFRKTSLVLTDSGATGNNSEWNAIVSENWLSTSGQTFNLWQNVQPAGFPHGSTGKNLNAYVPLKSSRDINGMPEVFNAPIAGIKGNYIICTNNIAGTLIKQLDLQMDDGNTASGAMMVSNAIGGAGIATDNIVDSSTYLVCLGV